MNQVQLLTLILQVLECALWLFQAEAGEVNFETLKRKEEITFSLAYIDIFK